MNIAIIGAGLSGSNLYRLLKVQNHDITVFEKSRGAGGRCSTRYINEKLIDHGTPFFTTSNKEFENFCKQKVSDNILIEKEDTYYPTKGMNKFISSSIEDEDLVKNTKIVSVKKVDQKWRLKDQNGIGYGSFDILILTIPPFQILELDIEINDNIKQKLKSVKYDSTATMMLYSYENETLDLDIFKDDKDFKKVVDNSLKYENLKYKDQNFSSYVFHLNSDETIKNNITTKDEVEKFFIDKFLKDYNIDLKNSFHILPHFWKYSFAKEGLKEEFIYDEQNLLGICGDYFSTFDLEGSFNSSSKLFEKIQNKR